MHEMALEVLQHEVERAQVVAVEDEQLVAPSRRGNVENVCKNKR